MLPLCVIWTIVISVWVMIVIGAKFVQMGPIFSHQEIVLFVLLKDARRAVQLHQHSAKYVVWPIIT